MEKTFSDIPVTSERKKFSERQDQQDPDQLVERAYGTEVQHDPHAQTPHIKAEKEMEHSSSEQDQGDQATGGKQSESDETIDERKEGRTNLASELYFATQPKNYYEH
ncbi:hypothetical protein MP228_009055 [Amoeboaphelidium protococcarum]|nr:hypothetical protein MP228_009055 [Amoeboaphelidium protococcarum]